eukprot:CAMPEP_0170447776 /NCGR_PEP_ID=MMETSP0117_2-20130122/50353_1 /TAXON_ID=400756 /ORGANISM="Durinskia baltica, Strain CSIRO CS-38" /LENGTH=51 /DNA_ID=CAMNT_0010708897 /DNA_START=109 /DNA_END=260 /DNA_ORIENTATION=-
MGKRSVLLMEYVGCRRLCENRSSALGNSNNVGLLEFNMAPAPGSWSSPATR